LQVGTDFSQGIAVSLNLESTIRSILENVGRLMPSELLELKLWDVERKALVPYRFQQSASARASTGALSPFGSLTDHLITRRTPLLITDTRTPSEYVRSDELLLTHSYLGIPLIAGGELVGTLEAGQTSGGAFGQHDLDLLSLISGQAAVAIRNARLYEEEQKRGSELAGLANLNQALGSARDLQDIFPRLVESVAPLFNAEIIVFLLYDEEKRTLEGKLPFRGLPAHVVQIYRAAVPVDSPAEKIIISQAPIITLNTTGDENWRALGLADMATAASLRDNALVPLLSSGRMLGYFQVGHHTRGVSAFTTDELRLMNIVANQAAAIIENVLLV